MIQTPSWLSHIGKLVVVLAALSLAAGCGGASATPDPVVHPAKGRLVNKAGQPVTVGMIELVSVGDPPRSARSELAADGTFTLSVMTAEGKKFDGAEEGEYRVTYIPRMSESQSEMPVTLRGTQKIVAGSNELNLKLP